MLHFQYFFTEIKTQTSSLKVTTFKMIKKVTLYLQ